MTEPKPVDLPPSSASARPLQDKVILITGATQGLGRALALACGQQGATVVLLGKSVKRLEAVYDLLLQAGAPEPAAIPLDLLRATELELEQLTQAITHQLGRLDGVVHLASHAPSLAPLEHLSLDEWMDGLKVNLALPMAMTRRLLPLLRASADASVIFCGHSQAMMAKAYWGHLLCAKQSLESMTRVAAQEWQHDTQLRVNLVIPGPMASPCRLRTHPAEDPALLPSVESRLPTFLHLLSAASAGTSGQIFDLFESDQAAAEPFSI